MSDPRELLGMLAARVQHFSAAPGGSPKLTPEDVAAALGMIQDPVARLYFRVKWVNQHAFAEELSLTFSRRVYTTISIGAWRVPRPAWIFDMCCLALAESIDPHVCMWCKGRGSAEIDSRVVMCDNCKGTGHKAPTDSDRARLMGALKSSWSDTWGKRYQEIQTLVDRVDDKVGAVAKRIGHAELDPA